MIIGTAGHIDHGKTVLVGALTGTDTDRLPEEKERGISIDLGFARVELQGGAASIVDVPGHERFIRNMVAGASGIDAAMVVIAADEGVMPQTTEHLDILDLLGVNEGVVVITKTDLAEDETWTEVVIEDVREELRGRLLEGAPVVRVSAVTGEGMDELRRVLTALVRRLGEGDPPGLGGPMRLPVDRCFTMAGFGSVVTGTLMTGTIAAEDRISIIPGRIEGRVRGVQVHGENVPEARAGQRVAVNIPQVRLDDLYRGQCVVEPGYYATRRVLAAALGVLPRAGDVSDGDRVRLHLGTAEVMARVTVLDGDAIRAGDRGYVRLRTEAPVCAVYADRFIVRRFSPIKTIGGGRILDINGHRYRKGRRSTLQHLSARDGTDLNLVTPLEQLCHEMFPPVLADLQRDLGRKSTQLQDALTAAVGAGLVRRFPGDILLPEDRWQDFVCRLREASAQYVQEHPLEEGLFAEEFRTRHFRRSKGTHFARLLSEARDGGVIQYSQGRVAPIGYDPRPSPEQRRICDEIRAAARDRGFTPPDLDQLAEDLSVTAEELQPYLRFLLDSDELVHIGSHYLDLDTWKEILELLRRWFSDRESMTVAELRDLLDTTRKYAVPLAEEMDTRKVTVRRGDLRYPGPALSEAGKASRHGTTS